MAHEAGIAIGDREVAFPRNDRQRRREPRRCRARGVHDDVGVEHVVAAAHGIRERSRRRGVPRARARRLRARRSSSQLRRTRRVDHAVARHEQTARRDRGRASARASPARARRAHRCAIPCSRVGRAASRAPRRAAFVLRDPDRAARVELDRARQLGASSRQSFVESAVSASCAGESSITTRWPMPAAVVPLAANARIEHEHAPARRARARARTPRRRFRRRRRSRRTVRRAALVMGCRMPQRNGSRGSKCSVASPVTNAVPRTCGSSAPSRPAVSQPVNRLPVMPSCRQRCAKREPATRMQRGHRRRRARSARRAIVFSARAEHVVARVGIGARRRRRRPRCGRCRRRRRR